MIIVISLITFILAIQTLNSLRNSFINNAKNLLESTYNQVINQHNSILFHGDSTLKLRKQEIKTNVNLSIEIVDGYYQEFLNGRYTEEEAKVKAINHIKKIRYSDGVGYFWINDTGRPFPKMVMHPTLPELDNQILDSPDFNYALGRGENLFKAFVDVTTEYGEGYVDYMWPKPTPEGLTEIQPKISFVKLYKNWNWIIGSGLYIDDIDKEVNLRINRVLDDLNTTIPKLNIGKSGYFYIFNEENEVLVHPNIRGSNISDVINQETGKLLTEELKVKAKSRENRLDYIWDRPGFEGKYIFKKIALVKEYQPLKWYIVASIYEDDFFDEIKPIFVLLFFTGFISLVIVVLLSIIISKMINKPLILLIKSISERDENGIPVGRIPHLKTKEHQILEYAINNMLDTIKNKNYELELHKEHLEVLVKERTRELEKSLSQLKTTQQKLIESEKLASLGGLVAGVAHEMNTPVGIGVTAASYLEESIEKFAQLFHSGNISRTDFESYLELCSDSSELILSNLKRASKLINSFKQLAIDDSGLNKQSFKIKEIVDEIILNIKPKVILQGHTIDIEVKKDMSLTGYSDYILQVISILTENSLYHGFKDMEGGKIEITFETEDENLIIRFRDNGMGITNEVLGKIYDPFFTTQRNIGVGLGLNIAYNIVKCKLNGELSCISTPNEFTEFKIFIPINL